MSDNWVVQNLENALETWNEKLAEIWQLITTTPQTFKGGGIWNVIVNINGAVQAIGLALLVLFFVVGMVKTCGSFSDVKKPEHALKLFIRFALAKGAITLINSISNSIVNLEIDIESDIANYAIITPMRKAYLIDIQKGNIVKPICTHLKNRLGSLENIEKQLKKCIKVIRKNCGNTDNYAGGNIINILSSLKMHNSSNSTNNLPIAEINGYDFSNISIFDAYLQNTNLYNCNFNQSNFKNCLFRQSFDPISSIVMSHNGKYIATAEATGIIHILRTSDYQIHSTLTGHKRWIFALAFSPNDEYLASGSEDKTVCLWNIGDKSSDCKLNYMFDKIHTNSIWSLAFHPSGTTLATGSEDKTISIINIKDKKCTQKLYGHDGKVFSVDFSNDGSQLISSSADKTIKIWNVDRRYKCCKTIKGHQGSIRRAIFSPDGKYIASCSWDKTVRLWQSKNYKEITNQRKIFHESIHYVVFHPYKELMAASSESGYIYIWNYKENTMLKVLKEHEAEVWMINFSDDGRYMISGGYDQRLKIWDTKTWNCIYSVFGFTEWIQRSCVSKDNKYLACTYGDLSIKVWDIVTGNKLNDFIGHSGWSFGLSINCDDILATGSDDKNIKLWDLNKPSNDIIECACLNNVNNALSSNIIHTSWIQTVAFSPNGKYLASGADDCTIIIWDIRTYQPVKVLRHHESGIWALAFSANGTHLISADEDGTIILWNWDKSSKPKKIFKGHADRIQCLFFTFDNLSIISGGEDGTVRKWNIKNGDNTILYKHNSWIMSISIYHELLLIGSKDGFIISYDINNNCILSNEQISSSGISSISFLDKGNRYITSDEGGNNILWEFDFNNRKVVNIKTLRDKKPYYNTNIQFAHGLTKAQIEKLIELGAN